MSTAVGAIHYEVALETAKMIEGQRAVDKELGKTTASLDRFQFKVSAVAAGIAILAAAMAAVKSAQMADEFRLLEARVNVAAGSIERGAEAMKALQGISQRTQTSLGANADVFGRLNQSILQMGGTQKDTLHLTELLGMAIKVSGASAVEAKTAMLQFGQAMGSGKLSGDELRSLLESAPYLMQQLAAGIGVPVGALKKMGEEGKLTADVVMAAMGKASEKIEADFATFPQTIGGAMEIVRDQAQRANKNFDDMTGTSAKLAGVTQGLGTVIGQLADQFQDATTESDKLGRNKEVKTWADTTANILTYVVDGADGVVRVFKHIGTAIGGMAAAAVAVANRDLSGARAIVKELDTDLDKLWAEQLAGEKMRARLAAAGGVSGLGGVMSALKPETETPKKKTGAQFDGAGYVASLESAATEGFAKINAIEEAALAKNAELLAKKKINAEQASKAITLIEQRAAKDRLDLQDGLDKKIEEALDRQAEREERNAQARAEAAILLTTSSEQRILLVRDEAVRQAEVAYRRGKTTFEEAETAKLKAGVVAATQLAEERKRREKEAIDFAAGLTRAVNPVDALRQEYEFKLDLVTQYEALMAQAGVDAHEQGQIARTQITAEYEAQRLALAEQSFRSQSEANAFLMDSLNSLASTASTAIMGLINGTMTAEDVMKSLANTVLNEAVNALVQIGLQQIKNALLSNTLAAAETARKATMGAVYTASVSAQVAGMSSLAAMNAFAATAAIPMVGPVLAPGAAAAAGAAAMALGAPAIATAPIAGARQYGGPVSADSLYRVNEGGRPEMFQAANGSQFLMPNKSGEVIPAGKGGAGGVTVVVENNGSPLQVTGQSYDSEARIVRVAVRQAKAEIAGEISQNTGDVYGALRGSTNLRGRL